MRICDFAHKVQDRYRNRLGASFVQRYRTERPIQWANWHEMRAAARGNLDRHDEEAEREGAAASRLNKARRRPR